MSHFDSCQLILIWLANITLTTVSRLTALPGVLSFFGKCVLYVGGAKRLVFHLSPRDGHVIIVSGSLILTAVNLIVLIRMAYTTERLVKLCKIYCDVWHRLTWIVCTGGRTLRHNQNFSDGKFAKFCYPWCPATSVSHAQELRYRVMCLTKPWSQDGKFSFFVLLYAGDWSAVEMLTDTHTHTRTQAIFSHLHQTSLVT